MASDRTFIALTPDLLTMLITGARRRVIYAAPSLSMPVAATLINASERLGEGAVAVVIDAGEGVLRLGYGVVDALALFREKRIPIRHHEGLRIAFVVVDDEGFIFALMPLLVEENSTLDDHPNAVRASRSQVEQLAEAVLPPRRPESPPLLAPAAPVIQQVEIGRAIVPAAQIEKLEETINKNPVENFGNIIVPVPIRAKVRYDRGAPAAPSCVGVGDARAATQREGIGNASSDD
jgi:hypothetical protein